VRTQRIQAVAHASDVLIGTNAFPHLQEAAAGVLDIAPHPATSAHEMAGAASLPRIRLAEPFEALRDASDRAYAVTKDRPRIFLATLGRSRDITARATYAKIFFAAGGIAATGDAKYENDEAILVAFKAAGVKLACLCGSDGALAREGAVVTRGLRAAGARHIYAAEAPDELREALRAAGVETVIDSGCDMLATLQAAWKELNG
jgi:methylmalonyl-CoA mutase